MAKRTWPRAAGYHWDQKDKVILPCGTKPCRWCKGPITAKRKRTFCSDACVSEWRRRAYPEEFRRVAFEADRGVCQLCEIDCRFLDTGWLEAQLWVSRGKRRIGRIPEWSVAPFNASDDEPYPAEWWLIRLDLANRWKVANNVPRHVFEIDHKRPIVEGGDFFDPANLRVLCLPCHKGVSKALVARLALARRQGGTSSNGVCIDDQ